MRLLTSICVVGCFFALSHAQTINTPRQGSSPLIINLQETPSTIDRHQLFRSYLNISGNDALVLQKKEKDQIGMEHEKYQQYYRGYRVEGATYTVHIKE